MSEFNYIRTFSGIAFPVTGAKPEQVCTEDIVHALPMITRFGGHCKRFYSVAEHTLLVAQLAETNGATQDEIDACILHDVSEIYLSDIPSPFRHLFLNYKEIEEGLQKIVYERFNCPLEKEQVDKFDRIALYLEGRQLLSSTDDWDFSKLPTFKNSVSISERVPTEVSIRSHLKYHLQDIEKRRS